MAELKAKNNGTSVLVEVDNVSKHTEFIQQKYPIEVVNENEFLVHLNTKEEVPTLLSFLINNNISVYKMQPQGGLEEWFINLTKPVKNYETTI